MSTLVMHEGMTLTIVQFVFKSVHLNNILIERASCAHFINLLA